MDSQNRASMENDREEFRRYLECAGVIDRLSKALLKLYGENNKPEDPIRYLCQSMCESCPTSVQFENLYSDYVGALENIRLLEREVSTLKGNIKRTPSAVQLDLENGMNSIENDENSKSLLKKYLNRELFDSLKDLKTSYKSTLIDCVQSGFSNPDSSIGIYAPDPEAYDVFADIFDPIIEEYHAGFQKCDIQPDLQWCDPTYLGDLDPENQYIISTRVRCARSIEGYPFNTIMSEKDYIDIENMVKTTLEGLTDEYKGTYYSLIDMDNETRTKLIENHILFKDGDRYLDAAKGCRYWPAGRGIFYNDPMTFIVWVNEEDHLRIISMECGGHLGVVYNRLIHGIGKIEEKITFNKHNRLGYLTFCPSNLGTTIRASVHIKLPKLSNDIQMLNELVEKHNLQIRGTHGEHTDNIEGIYDISNKRRLGKNEFDIMMEMYQGLTEIIRVEKEML